MWVRGREREACLVSHQNAAEAGPFDEAFDRPISGGFPHTPLGAAAGVVTTATPRSVAQSEAGAITKESDSDSPTAVYPYQGMIELGHSSNFWTNLVQKSTVRTMKGQVDYEKTMSLRGLGASGRLG